MNKKMLTKVCSLRDPENIARLSALNPDYMGFQFSPLSARYMGEVDESLLYNLPPKVRRIGLFCDQSPLYIVSLAGRFGLNAVQLCGQEPPSTCELLAAEGLEVVKSFTIATRDSYLLTQQYEGVCNKFLFRFAAPHRYALAAEYGGTTPFLVHSDFNSRDLELCSTISHGLLCGVDIAPVGDLIDSKEAFDLLSLFVNFGQ